MGIYHPPRSPLPGRPMSLTLSTEDLRLLSQAQQAILSPSLHQDPRTWAHEVITRVAPLVGADSGAFGVVLPGEEDRPLSGTLNIDDSTMRAYGEYYMERELLPPSPSAAVHYLPDAVSPETLESSEIYNDFWKPTRQFDNLAMTSPLPEGGQAMMFLQHATPHGPRFGERGKALLKLLMPVMKAGAETYARWARRNAKLLRFLDRVEDGLILCDADGRTRHANSALSRLLADEPEAERVRSEAEALAGRMASLLRGVELLREDPAAPAPVRVATESGAFRIRASYLDESALGGPGILVTVKVEAGHLPSMEALQERLGLTRRQAEVALLLARRKTNEEIAEVLFISPHTARRHTESVFLKLGVSSRLDVRQALAA